MGSGTAETLSEIRRIRERLDHNVTELERRLPPVAQLGRKALAIALGGGAGGTALWFAARRLRPKRKKEEAPAPVVVNVFPKGAVAVGLGAVAVWAGVRLYEAKLKAEGRAGERPRPAVVTPMPEAGRGTSS